MGQTWHFVKLQRRISYKNTCFSSLILYMNMLGTQYKKIGIDFISKNVFKWVQFLYELKPPLYMLVLPHCYPFWKAANIMLCRNNECPTSENIRHWHHEATQIINWLLDYTVWLWWSEWCNGQCALLIIWRQSWLSGQCHWFPCRSVNSRG